MITGYERVSTTEQDLGLKHDDLKPAPMLRSIRPKRARLGLQTSPERSEKGSYAVARDPFGPANRLPGSVTCPARSRYPGPDPRRDHARDSCGFRRSAALAEGWLLGDDRRRWFTSCGSIVPAVANTSGETIGRDGAPSADPEQPLRRPSERDTQRRILMRGAQVHADTRGPIDRGDGSWARGHCTICRARDVRQRERIGRRSRRPRMIAFRNSADFSFGILNIAHVTKLIKGLGSMGQDW